MIFVQCNSKILPMLNKEITKNEFDLLIYLKDNKNLNQRKISSIFNFSLGKTNYTLKSLEEKGLIKDLKVTEYGIDYLEKFKVDNAIVLAAGMSTRFAPVSYEISKSLIRVNGEIMIERIIRQLREKGIQEIIIVVGYMMEKFLYLQDKFNVKLVVNNEFRIKNTHSSINCVKQYLKNSYIVCADNYFKENVFNTYEYKAFYSSVYIKELNYERGLITDSNGLIIDTVKPAENMWVMFGHVFFDKEFSNKFKKYLTDYFGRPGIENYYWEWIYCENLKDLHMYIKKYPDGVIYEFDSLEDLRAYSPDYLKENNIELVNNICRTLNCQVSDISKITKVNGGLSNTTFLFEVKGKKYCYRFPGVVSSKIHDRKIEKLANEYASKLGIDHSLVYLDDNTGWKVSKFIETTETYDPENIKHIKQLCEVLRKLHKTTFKVGKQFDYYKEAIILSKKIIELDPSADSMLQNLIEKASLIYKELALDNWPISLNHNDIDIPNLLIANDHVELIDWEFAADGDAGFDICKTFTFLPYKKENVIRGLTEFYQRAPELSEIYHIINCACINYFYWVIWSIYMTKSEKDYSTYTLVYFERFITYFNISNQIKKKGTF